MISMTEKEKRSGRRIYQVGDGYLPATTEQGWTEAQLVALDGLVSRINFDYWVTVGLNEMDYVGSWKSGRRTVLFYDKEDRIHAIWIESDGTLLREVFSEY